MGVDLHELGEFGFIDRVRRAVPSSSAIGIGDDAAVMRSGAATLVAATDTLVQHRHFRLDWSEPTDVGWKAVVVNVSDVAAMGAEPSWVLVSLGAPPDTRLEVLDGIYEGMVEACRTYGADIVGGDTVRTQEIVLSVTVVGELDGAPMLRSGAEVGDVLAVTGPLGAAAAGVNLLTSQDPRGVSPEDAIACMDAHRRPRARLIEGVALGRAGVHAAIDLSDGLASDVRRLAEASGVGIELWADRIPVAEEARRVAQARGWDLLQMALGGGEDFELLVAAPEDLTSSVELIEVGRVVDEGVWILVEGERRTLDIEGWDHFSL